jgi:SAM-dependent methyltransferase
MEKIGTDLSLYRPYIRKHAHKIVEILFGYASPDMFREPWLDVGAGENYMRDLLAEKTGKQIQSSEIDLDITPYEFDDNHFQTITSFELLEHLYNPLFHLMELHRVLSPEGNLFLLTPNDYSLIYKAEHLLSRKYHPHFHQFREKDLRDILARAGFRIVVVKKLRRGISGTLARISRDRLFVHAQKGVA